MCFRGAIGDCQRVKYEIKKTWLVPSLSEGGRLVALMQQESI